MKVRTSRLLNDEQRALVLSPRDDFVLEEQVSGPNDEPNGSAFNGAVDGEVHFQLAEGPFSRFDRTVTVAAEGPGQWRVQQETSFKTAIPVWGWAFAGLTWLELRRAPKARGTMPWWSPPDRVDTTTAASLAYLSVLALISGYLGSLLSQTVAFAGAEFGADSSAQSTLAGWVRVGVPIALVLGILADRIGRRRTILWAATFACCLAAVTAATPTFWGYGASQAVARGTSAGLALLVGVAAAEETPDGSRAFITSVLTAAAGLGSGMVLWFVPLTEFGERAWRVLFLIPIVALPAIAWMWRRLPETRRFRAAVEAGESTGIDGTSLPRALRKLAGNRRFQLLAVTALLLSMFAAPASTLQTTYLTTERDFDATTVTLFKLVTGTPVGIGLLIAGKLADLRGRRVVGAVGLVAGVLFTALEYTDSGWRIWMWGVLGTLLAAAVAPALGVYGPELFSTRSRSFSNGALMLVGTAGSAMGLFFAAWSLDQWNFSVTFGLLTLAPIIVAILVIFVYPETANRSLEELNPSEN